jgi:uracil phosphoribosyltransferase
MFSTATALYLSPFSSECSPGALSASDKAHFIGSNGVSRTFYGGRVVLLESKAINALMTTIRQADVSRADNVSCSDRLLNILVEEGLAYLPAVTERTVTTACGTYTGLSNVSGSDIVAVSIVRSGDILLEAVRRALPDVGVAKILIQRDENANPQLYYSKLPRDVATKQVLLCDPMLATGGSAITAIRVLKDAGVEESNIVFINVVAVHEGLHAILEEFPAVKIVTMGIDPLLNSHKYIAPGLGDFGDRYYGTE